MCMHFSGAVAHVLLPPLVPECRTSPIRQHAEEEEGLGCHGSHKKLHICPFLRPRRFLHHQKIHEKTPAEGEKIQTSSVRYRTPSRHASGPLPCEAQPCEVATSRRQPLGLPRFQVRAPPLLVPTLFLTCQKFGPNRKNHGQSRRGLNFIELGTCLGLPFEAKCKKGFRPHTFTRVVQKKKKCNMGFRRVPACHLGPRSGGCDERLVRGTYLHKRTTNARDLSDSRPAPLGPHRFTPVIMLACSGHAWSGQHRCGRIWPRPPTKGNKKEKKGEKKGKKQQQNKNNRKKKKNRWGPSAPQGWGPRVEARKGGGPEFLTFIPFSRTKFQFVFPSPRVCLILVVFRSAALKCVRVEFSGHLARLPGSKMFGGLGGVFVGGGPDSV